MTNLTQLRNFILEHRLPLVSVMLLIILLPIVIIRLAHKNNPVVPPNLTTINIRKPMDTPQNAKSVRIIYSGKEVNTPKSISSYTQNIRPLTTEERSKITRNLDMTSEPKTIPGVSESFLYNDQNYSLSISPQAYRLSLNLLIPGSGQNDQNNADIEVKKLLSTLGININSSLSAPTFKTFDDTVYNTKLKASTKTSFLQLNYSQTIDGIPVITNNPQNYVIQATFSYGKIQNFNIDLTIENAPAKQDSVSTLPFPQVLKNIEAGQGVYISADNPEDHVLYSAKTKQVSSIDLTDSQVSYYKISTQNTISYIPVLLFTGTSKLESGETRNVRIITPVIATISLTQP